MSSNIKTIDVAIAVISFNHLYLLGYRNEKQYQGDKYEFVGGKIEDNESSISAIVREINEEIGVIICADQCKFFGTIRHQYTEKAVHLQVFHIELNNNQFMELKDQKIGKLGQPLAWVSLKDLKFGKYPLPDANKEILEWL